MQFSFVTVIPKYFDLATFLKAPLAIKL